MISICSFEAEDLDKLARIQQDVRTKELMQGFSLPHSKEAIHEWFLKIRNPGRFPTNIYWAIRLNSEFIGYCCLLDINWISKNAHVGIVISQSGLGLGNQALSLMEERAYLHLGLSKLYAKVIENNLPARKLFERRGYSCEGILKRDHIFQGNLVNNYIYAKFAP